MNQLGSDSFTIIGNTEEENMNEEDDECDEQGVDPSKDIHSTPVNDVVNDSTLEADSHSVITENYSSLNVRQITQQQPAAYSQIYVQAANVAEVNEHVQQNDIVESIPHSYYNIP